MACVYIHTFPNGKKYVGITCEENPARRWSNGYGYCDNKEMFDDIVMYGWGNIDHKIVFDCNIDDKFIDDDFSSDCIWSIEQYLISKYQTYMPSKGYNKDTESENDRRTKNVRKPCALVDKCGEVYMAFESRREMSLYTGITTQNIGKAYHNNEEILFNGCTYSVICGDKYNRKKVKVNILQDHELSLKAKGLYLILREMQSQDRIITKDNVFEKCSEGKKAFDSAWKELITAGYLAQKRRKNDRNQFYYTYMIS